MYYNTRINGCETTMIVASSYDLDAPACICLPRALCTSLCTQALRYSSCQQFPTSYPEPWQKSWELLCQDERIDISKVQSRYSDRIRQWLVFGLPNRVHLAVVCLVRVQPTFHIRYQSKHVLSTKVDLTTHSNITLEC